MNHLIEYKKLKKKYLNLKRISTYEFKYFGDSIEQENFIKKNINIINGMIVKCFPHGIQLENNELLNYEEMINVYEEINKNLIYKNINNQWFFALQDNKIIGFCYIANELEFAKTHLKLATYKVIKISEDKLKKIELVEKGPVINGLCKNMSYKNVGSFILNNVFDYLKKMRYDIIYIVPESSYGKVQYLYFIGQDACNYYDYKKYFESNKKLIKYYKELGFIISPKLYDIVKCSENYEPKYHLYNVLYKKL